MQSDNMVSNSPKSSPPVMLDERYKAALESHNHEFRTLGERASIFGVVQSILIGASVLTLTNQQIFGYIFPFLFSGLVFIGALFCLLHFGAGHMGADSAFRWRQYMRFIEQNQSDMPWVWFYTKYEEKYGNKRALEMLPLPSNWLYPPTIFLFMWLIASVYIPGRILFDNSFAVSSYRPAVFVTSIAIGAFVLAVFCLLSCKTIASLKNFIQVIRNILLSKKEG